MKKILLSACMLALFATTTVAQRPMQRPDAAKGKMHNTHAQGKMKCDKACCVSAVETTQAQVEHLKALLQLTDDQSRRIYAILLKENRNDSIAAVQMAKMRNEKMTRHDNQMAEIKKVLTPSQQAAMEAMPAFMSGRGMACDSASMHCGMHKMKMSPNKSTKQGDKKSSKIKK